MKRKIGKIIINSTKYQICDRVNKIERIESKCAIMRQNSLEIGALF